MKKKIINEPTQVVAQCAEGFLAAHGDLYEKIPGVAGLKVRKTKDKTALVIGGGSGHEPMFGFFLGENLADATASGNVFASPDPNTIMQTAVSVACGKGVLFVYGNYAGDNMNFDIAAEMLEDMGIESKTVRVWDDVASAPKSRIEDRRGIAGDLFVVRIAGAATGAGLSLDEAFRITEKARDNTFSIGIALSGATIPGEENAIFTLPEDEMEYGMGIHGEAGICRVKMEQADVLVENLYHKLIDDSGIHSSDVVCTFVNGLGSTTLMELYIINRKLRELLEADGIKIHDMVVDSLVTSQEMAGASITLMRLDEELEQYYNMPCYSPHYQFNGKE